MKVVCSRKSLFGYRFILLFFSAGTLRKLRKMQAPSGLQSDVIIQLSAEDVEKSSGLSIDIGKARLIYF